MGIEKRKGVWIPRREKMFGYKEEEIRLYTQVEKIGEIRVEKIPEEGKGHMKRKFSCALKFYLVISNIQAGNMRLKFNIICRLVAPAISSQKLRK